jgi:hypothetical protein
MYPGGNINLIVYQSFLGENGLPMTHGEDLKPYFTKAFYEKKVPVWTTSDKEGWFGEVAEETASSSASVGVSSPKLFIGLALLAAFVAVLLGLPRVKLKRP